METDKLTKAATIAIDGPAASGKSTIGAMVAEELEYLYFDTGVMYRAVTWGALARGIAIEDEARVTRLAEMAKIDVVPPTVDDGRQYTVQFDGQDITWEIRRAQVNEHVSPVSTYSGVRAALTAQQRRIGLQGNVVMVGRDIGTVVLPEAELKIYLDASLEERARRRYKEERARGVEANYNLILKNLGDRDRIDSNRAVAPLRAADDAVVVDTTDLSVDAVVQKILSLCS